jgi:hypothetical protein
MVYQRRWADGTLLVMTGEDKENKESHIQSPIFGNAIFNSTMKISVDAHMDMNFQGCDCYLCGVVIVAFCTSTTLTQHLSTRHIVVTMRLLQLKKGFICAETTYCSPVVSNGEGLEWLRYNGGTWLSLFHQRTSLQDLTMNVWTRFTPASSSSLMEG